LNVMQDSFMALARKLPRTIEEYYLALHLCKEKKDYIGIGQTVLRPATAQDLDTLFELFKAARNERLTAKTKSLSATKEVRKAVERLSMFNSHFLQHLDDAIMREVATVADKISYNIDANATALPVQRKQQQVVTVANDIVKGEAARVLRGGIALLQPSAAEISDLLQDLQMKLVAKGKFQSEYNDRQEALQKLIKDTDKLVRKMWAEVESTCAGDPEAGSRRRKAEQWSVVYAEIKRKRKAKAVGGEKQPETLPQQTVENDSVKVA